MIENHHKNIATFIHLSTFSRFIIPLGNYLAPLVLWMLNRDKSNFINEHGKQALNFQLSILLYTIIVGLITVPFLVFNLLNGFSFSDMEHFRFNIKHAFPSFLILGGSLGFLAVIAFLFEVVLVIIASLKAKEGKKYVYPLTINFIK